MNAHDTYLRKRLEIKTAIATLQTALENMDREELKQQSNWGYAGIADHVLEILNEINDFFGSKSL